MVTVSLKIPDKMKKKVEEMSQEGMYQNDSEYIRSAIREKLESDSGMTLDEEKEILKRIEELEKEEAETVPLEEIK